MMAHDPNASRVDLHSHAAESIAFIRDTMARSVVFTAVPGRGGVAMGVVGLLAAWIAQGRDARGWLIVWLAAAAVAIPVGLLAMHIKARAHGLSLSSAAGRRFAQGLVPALAAGAVLTAALMRDGSAHLLPGTWLLLYGAAITAGAVGSVPVLTLLGCALMATGTAAFATPDAWGNAWLAAGFGGLQIAFGIHIARRHGG